MYPARNLNSVTNGGGSEVGANSNPEIDLNETSEKSKTKAQMQQYF